MPDDISTPALDRWNETLDQREAIIRFLEESGYDLCSWDDETEDYEPVRRPIGALLNDYFGIDPAGLEAERRALLDAWRSHQEA